MMPYDYERAQEVMQAGQAVNLEEKMSNEEAAAAEYRDMQLKVNESIYARIAQEYEEAVRTLTFLEQALEASRQRQQILGGAMDRLNAPQGTTTPSLR